MSFLYPRTVSVARPPDTAPAGVQPYGDLTQDEESVILTGLRASIQNNATAGSTGAALPGDARALTTWRIFIPLSALPDRTAIKTRDVMIDDQGRRFQVTAAYWNSLGWNCLSDLLEV